MRTNSNKSTVLLLAAAIVGTALVSVSPIRAWTTTTTTTTTSPRTANTPLSTRPFFSGGLHHGRRNTDSSRTCCRYNALSSRSAPLFISRASSPILRAHSVKAGGDEAPAVAAKVPTKAEVSGTTSSSSSTFAAAEEHTLSPDFAADFTALIQTQSPDYEKLGKKVLNGAILALSFGYAAYTIFSVDSEMVRGWTQSEIAMRVPLDNWSNYETSLAEKPIYTKTLINVIIYLLGDWLSQTVFQKKNVLDFDPIRVMRNGLIGLGFGPLVHEYYQFSDHILPVEGGLINRLEKIAMDQTLYLTVKCSIYIMAVGLLSGEDFSTVKKSVKERIGGICFTAWKFWPLIHCITYSVVPARHRILWVNCVDLVWNAILASLTNNNGEEEATAAAIVASAEDKEGEEEGVTMTVLAADTTADEHAALQDPFALAHELMPAHLFSTSFSDETTTAEDEEAQHVVLTAATNEGPAVTAGNSTVVAVSA